jgi:hypothetical protein
MPSKVNLRSASTKRLPQASADTSIEAFSRGECSAISLVAPFEGAQTLSRPEIPSGLPGPVLVPLDGGPVVPLAGDSIVIGRDPECELCIASNQVSSRHCELRPNGSSWEVVDLGSKNGTQVNGTPVTDRILKHGDRLTLAKQVHFRIDFPAGNHLPPGRLTSWLLYGIVAATLALTGLSLWRLFG